MTYSEFVSSFFDGLTLCTRWLKTHLFALDGNSLFSDNLIFTILAISIFLLLIEEILGLITSFRFGGFLFRRFGRSYGSGYKVKYEQEYPKAYEVDYSSEHNIKPFRSGFRTKYLISYNGKYYPFRHSRFNPFYARQFNSAYRSGMIVSASDIYGQKNGSFSSFGHSNNSSHYGYNADGLTRNVTFGYKMFNKLYGFLKKKKNDNDNEEHPDADKYLLAKQQVEEMTYNDNADWESLQANESRGATYDGPRPADLSISVDDDD